MPETTGLTKAASLFIFPFASPNSHSLILVQEGKGSPSVLPSQRLGKGNR